MKILISTAALMLSLSSLANTLPANGFSCSYKTGAGKNMTVVSFNKVPKDYSGKIWAGQVLVNNGSSDQIFEIDDISVGKSGIAGKGVLVNASNAQSIVKITYKTAAPLGSIEIKTLSGKTFKSSMTCKLVP